MDSRSLERMLRTFLEKVKNYNNEKIFPDGVILTSNFLGKKPIIGLLIILGHFYNPYKLKKDCENVKVLEYIEKYSEFLNLSYSDLKLVFPNLDFFNDFKECVESIIEKE